MSTWSSPPARTVHGAPRLVRGWAGALIATVIAAGSHTIASHGHPDAGPSPLVWILTLALAAPVCTALAGRMLSWTRLGLGVLLSQGVFHALYSWGPGTTPVLVDSAGVSATAGHAAHTVHGHAHHLAAVPVATPAGGAAEVATAAPEQTMVVAHLAAALVTVVLLRTGERIVLTTAEWVLLRRVELILLPHPLPAVRSLRGPWADVGPVVLWARDLVTGLRWRGPPALSFAR